MKTLVFLAGFLAVSYGVFIAFFDSAFEAALWVLAGLSLQLASGSAGSGNLRGQLQNPVEVAWRGLRGIRARVQSWDRRP